MESLILHSYFSLLSLLSAPPAVDTVWTLPNELEEISGMAIGADGLLYAHSDSGNEPILYGLDSTGTIVRKVYFTNATNVDWEEMTTDEQGNFYIGDFGNNANKRKNQVIYKLSAKEFYQSDTLTAEIIRIKFDDQNQYPPEEYQLNYDMEAMIVRRGRIYLFSKNRTKPFSGFTRMHSMPAVPGNYSLTVKDSLFLGEGPKERDWVSGAALSPDGRCLVLLGYDKMWVIQDSWGSDWLGGHVSEIPFNSLSQREAATFVNDSILLISDEKNIMGGQQLYRMNLGEVRRVFAQQRRKEVSVAERVIEDNLTFSVETWTRGPIYYSLISSNGVTVTSGKIGVFDAGEHTIEIPVEDLIPGAYIFNIQVGHERHGFIMRKYGFKKE
ncbi:MAG: hypothetical protein SchgKO_13970 [Schleiferiaceae bacterium]